MSRKINIDFFRIEYSERANAFESLLQQVILMPTAARTAKVRSTPIRLQQAFQDSQKPEFWQGEVLRIRMVDPPVKASLTGAIEDIHLEDDEGIGERTAFLYHSPTRVLLLQKTQSGVSLVTFLKYLQQLTQSGEELAADAVLHADAMRKLAKMSVIHKFQLSVAGLDHLGTLQGQDQAVSEIINLSEEFQSPTLSLTLSMSHKREGSISVEKVTNVAKRLLFWSEQSKKHQQNEQIKAGILRITGSTDDDNARLYVDLLRDRMRARLEIPGVTGRRNISYSERMQAIKKAWEMNKQEIFSMFSSNSSLEN